MEMERYAQINNIPIVEVDAIKFIMKYIRMNEVKQILEIGGGLGYAAILMANATPEVEITTIEKDEKRYREAVKNVNKCNLDKRIEIVYNDALEVNLAGHAYDLIFLDAAKGSYIKFFEKFCNYLNPGGVIITDNLRFHGLVNSKSTVSKSLRGIIDKIERYLEFLNKNEDYVTKFYDIGNGLSVSIKKNNSK